MEAIQNGKNGRPHFVRLFRLDAELVKATHCKNLIKENKRQGERFLMIKKIVLWMGILLYTALFVGSQAHAEAFSELYRSSGLKAFLADGRLLFEQLDSAEQTAKLVCTSKEGRTMWEAEHPSSVYGGTLLAQAGEEILYACRLPENNRVALTRYSQEGRRLSAHTLPEDAGMHLLVDNQVYFISEGALKACNSEGEIQTVSPDDLGNCISLYEAEGNNAAAAFQDVYKRQPDVQCVPFLL